MSRERQVDIELTKAYAVVYRQLHKIGGLLDMKRMGRATDEELIAAFDLLEQYKAAYKKAHKESKK